MNINKPRSADLRSDAEGWLQFACVCGREWRELVPLPIITLALANRIRSARCPSCGKADVYFVFNPD